MKPVNFDPINSKKDYARLRELFLPASWGNFFNSYYIGLLVPIILISLLVVFMYLPRISSDAAIDLTVKQGNHIEVIDENRSNLFTSNANLIFLGLYLLIIFFQRKKYDKLKAISDSNVVPEFGEKVDQEFPIAKVSLTLDRLNVANAPCSIFGFFRSIGVSLVFFLFLLNLDSILFSLNSFDILKIIFLVLMFIVMSYLGDLKRSKKIQSLLRDIHGERYNELVESLPKWSAPRR